MSYIVAFVKYQEHELDYPVACFRKDLAVGDWVVVRRRDDSLKQAMITNVVYLNWNCKGRVECLTSEAVIDPQGVIQLPDDAPVTRGIVTHEGFIQALKTRGWVQLKRHHRMYIAILAYKSDTQIGTLFVRKNGVDVQTRDAQPEEDVVAGSVYEGSLSQGRVVRHALSHTTFNLFHGLLRFSDSFQRNEEDLDRYFVSVGSADRRTARLKAKAQTLRRSRPGSGTDDIYDACSSGDGGPAYLGDGIWVNEDGGMFDAGR